MPWSAYCGSLMGSRPCRRAITPPWQTLQRSEGAAHPARLQPVAQRASVQQIVRTVQTAYPVADVHAQATALLTQAASCQIASLPPQPARHRRGILGRWRLLLVQHSYAFGMLNGAAAALRAAVSSAQTTLRKPSAYRCAVAGRNSGTCGGGSRTWPDTTNAYTVT